MGSNPTLVEPGKIVELCGNVFKIESIYRDAHGTLRSFVAQMLIREDDDAEEFPDLCSMEVLDEELLNIYSVH